MSRAATKQKTVPAKRETALAQERIADIGPAMSALTEKQRRDVLALFDAPRTHGSGVFAVKIAGYGTPTSSRQSLAQLAYQLNNDPKVQAANRRSLASVSHGFGPACRAWTEKGSGQSRP